MTGYGQGVANQFLPTKVPIGIAHRGGTDAAPENTKGAFAHAVTLGYTYLELDVHRSADGEVVVWHDETLSRVAGIDRAVSDMTWNELAAIRIDHEHSLVRLAELLGQYPNARFNIEPKHDAVVDSLIAVLRTANAVDRVCVGSFSDRRIKRFRSEFGSDFCTSAGPVELAKTFLSAYVWPWFRPRHQCVQIPIRAYGIPLDRPGFIRRVQKLGLQVHYWTINDESEMVRLLNAGADGIMTDNIGLLKTVLESRSEWSDNLRS